MTIIKAMGDTATAQKTTNAFAGLSREELLVSVTDLARKLKQSEHQLDWFKRQLFGQKSEKRFMDNPNQLGFGMEGFEDMPEQEDNRPETTVSYTRKKGPKRRPDDCVTDCGLRFDPSVPVKTIQLNPDEIDGLAP